MQRRKETELFRGQLPHHQHSFQYAVNGRGRRHRYDHGAGCREFGEFGEFSRRVDRVPRAVCVLVQIVLRTISIIEDKPTIYQNTTGGGMGNLCQLAFRGLPDILYWHDVTCQINQTKTENFRHFAWPPHT
jgi:hypothetical protein